MYRHLNVKADPDLSNLDWFIIKKVSKTGNIELHFFDGKNQRHSLTNKQTGEFLAPKTLRETFVSLNTMKSLFSIDETPSALEKPVKATIKLQNELPTDL